MVIAGPLVQLTSLSVQEVGGSIPDPVKLVSATARHRCDIFSKELCCPSASRNDGPHHLLYASV